MKDSLPKPVYCGKPLYRIEDCGFETPCWVWQRGTTSAGYGIWTVNGEKILGHRLSFECHVRKLKPREEVHHRCEVRACVNPGHLEALSNVQHKRTHGRRRITDEQECELLRLYKTGIPVKEIGDILGFRDDYVGYIANMNGLYRKKTTAREMDGTYIPANRKSRRLRPNGGDNPFTLGFS